MLYIIEGIDKCGKSTFIDRQAITHYCNGIDEFRRTVKDVRTGDKIAVHFDDTDIDPVESLKVCCAVSHLCDVFMDRSWISDMVYGVVYRGVMRLEPRDDQYIVGMLQETPHIVYYFDKQISKADIEDKFEKDTEKMQLVKTRYKQVISRYKKQLNIYHVEAMI